MLMIMIDDDDDDDDIFLKQAVSIIVNCSVEYISNLLPCISEGLETIVL